jgi:uncharacterized protein (TIGR02611 family)
VAIGIVGGTVLAIGLALMVLPGPAFLVIPAGLAILSTEFSWAQRLKDRGEERFRRWREDRKKRQDRKRSEASAA